MLAPPLATTLTLGHSPDPDDVFMWWPLTGKIFPTGGFLPGPDGKPALNTGGLEFRPLAEDISVLNRHAIVGRELYEITALSARAYASVADRYIITACGGSFGQGFGPKVVVKDASAVRTPADLRSKSIRIAVPGKQTTAFMVLGLVLGADWIREHDANFVEMRFNDISPAVVRGEVDAGLLIHESQVTFAQHGLRMVLDEGVWWKERTGLVLPLGVNAIRRDLDATHGPGTLAKVAGLLSQSVAYSAERRTESTTYTLPFAKANADRNGEPAPTLEQVDRYCRMYVSAETLDMGEAGLRAMQRLLGDGASAGLCPDPGVIDLI